MTDAAGAVPLAEIVSYADDYLRIRDIPDYANAVNGLQVENSGRVGRIVAAVDASQETIDGVVDAYGRDDGAPPLILVHHGLFWDGNIAVTGRRYRRLSTLLLNDVALYAAHLPLDAHPEVGNNAVLARRLGIEVDGAFGSYQGVPVGVAGALELPRSELVARLDSLLDTTARCVPGGPERTRRVGVVTGGGGGMAAEAIAAGCDTLVTGEGAHHTYFDATELGINLIYAGHYATEQVGVQALAEHLGIRFELPWEFHWHPTGI
jgi:dinuclear metal center YbgI/SA1388 family protein